MKYTVIQNTAVCVSVELRINSKQEGRIKLEKNSQTIIPLPPNLTVGTIFSGRRHSFVGLNLPVSRFCRLRAYSDIHRSPFTFELHKPQSIWGNLVDMFIKDRPFLWCPRITSFMKSDFSTLHGILHVTKHLLVSSVWNDLNENFAKKKTIFLIYYQSNESGSFNIFLKNLNTLIHG